MNNKHILLTESLLAFLLLTLALSCGEGNVAPPANLDVAERYYPLSIGQTKVYEVDSILLFATTSGIAYDTALLDVKETLVDTFTTADGRLWYRGERYEKDRNAAESAYRITRVFALHSDGMTALRQEDNLNFTKLVSPFRTGQQWDGNNFDDTRQFTVGGEFLDIYAGWEYRYDEMKDSSINGQPYQELIVVEQAEITDNLIDYRRAYELYAPGVGLVASFVDARHTQCQSCCNGNTATCFDLPWNEKAEKGFILRQRLVQ